MSKALKQAIEANDPDAVRKALKSVRDVNRKIAGAESPLIYASRVGADKVLKALFEAGAIVEKRNTFPGDTPFAVAAAHCQFEVMRKLLVLKQSSEEVVRFVVEDACMAGNADVLAFMLDEVRPAITIELFRLASATSKSPTLLKMLVQHGGDLNARHNTRDAETMTPLHDLVGGGKSGEIRTLVECGADVNARDGLGRTPLMILAASVEGIEISNVHARITKQFLARGKARLHGEPPSTVNAMEALRTLLDLGADARLRDHAGNDAIDHCRFEFMRSGRRVPKAIIRALLEAGAKGSEPTIELYQALYRNDLKKLRTAILNGADVNRLKPPPVPSTPLTLAASDSSKDAVEVVRALLRAGADPNRSDRHTTPLIAAARSGNLESVRELVNAGADLHAIYEPEGYVENAYSVADDEIGIYLKSLGARNPISTRTEALTPGVKSWNDFDELLVKGAVREVAEGLARMIRGQVRLNVYEQSLHVGKQAYVVVRPKEMAWCNVFQITPSLQFGDSKGLEAAATAVAKACRAPVLAIQYSDTSDAASILRIEPAGDVTRDTGWDHESLKEMVEALADRAPAWAKKQLAKTSEDEPDSTERLKTLAEQEKFVVAAFSFGAEEGHNVDVECAGYGAEAFDGVAFVSN